MGLQRIGAIGGVSDSKWSPETSVSRLVKDSA
jgi:hypothetical protein